MAHCPECDAVLDLELDEIEEGLLVSCPECGVDLEVLHTNPLELDLAEGDEVDADDDEDLDEDEDEDEDMGIEEDDEEEQDDDYDE